MIRRCHVATLVLLGVVVMAPVAADDGDADSAGAAPGDKGFDLHDPVWSPDGRQIAFYSNADGDFDIYVLDLESRAVTQATDNDTHDSNPAWAPDGRLAFTSDRGGRSDIYLLKLESGTLTRVTDTEEGEGGQRWAPSGEWIAFERRRDGNHDIYLVSPTTGVERRLTEQPGNDFRPSWCPGGDRIVFQSKRGEVYHLYAMTVDGADIVQLTSGDDHRAAPSCGSRTGRIAYVLHDASGKASIHAIEPNGSGDRALTASSGGSDMAPDWSPDESQIVFYSDRDGSLALYVMSGDGSSQTRIYPDRN